MGSIKSFIRALGAAALLLASAVDARPNGAPRCAINPDAISGAHQSQPVDLGAKLVASSATYTPGQVMEVTVEGPAEWKGLLLYGAQGEAEVGPGKADGRKAHVGKFMEIPQNFKAQAVDICQTAGITNEADGSNPVEASTITHANGQAKGGKVVFKWQAPANNVGPVSIVGAVAMGGPGGKWGVLNQIVLQPAGGAANGAVGGVVQQTGAKVDGNGQAVIDILPPGSDCGCGFGKATQQQNAGAQQPNGGVQQNTMVNGQQQQQQGGVSIHGAFQANIQGPFNGSFEEWLILMFGTSDWGVLTQQGGAVGTTVHIGNSMGSSSQGPIGSSTGISAGGVQSSTTAGTAGNAPPQQDSPSSGSSSTGIAGNAPSKQDSPSSSGSSGSPSALPSGPVQQQGAPAGEPSPSVSVPAIPGVGAGASQQQQRVELPTGGATSGASAPSSNAPSKASGAPVGSGGASAPAGNPILNAGAAQQAPAAPAGGAGNVGTVAVSDDMIIDSKDIVVEDTSGAGRRLRH